MTTYRDSVLPRAREAYERRGWGLRNSFINLEKYGDTTLPTTFHDIDQAAEDAVLSGNDYAGTIVCMGGETYRVDLTDHGEVLKAEDEREAEDSRQHENGLRNWYYGRVL